MAAFKPSKQIKQDKVAKGKAVEQQDDPRKYYNHKPSWNFSSCDKEQWTFSHEHAGDAFWSDILPVMKEREAQTWSEILVTEKKKNHTIPPEDLNPLARRRLVDLFVEAESIVSLRINGTKRLYGYMIGSVFNMLWYDDDHGDNDRCVCRSTKKHT